MTLRNSTSTAAAAAGGGGGGFIQLFAIRLRLSLISKIITLRRW